MSVVACEYARLFYHVFKNTSGSSQKKYIKVDDCFRYCRNVELLVRFLPIEIQTKMDRVKVRFYSSRMSFGALRQRILVAKSERRANRKSG